MVDALARGMERETKRKCVKRVEFTLNYMYDELEMFRGLLFNKVENQS